MPLVLVHGHLLIQLLLLAKRAILVELLHGSRAAGRRRMGGGWQSNGPGTPRWWQHGRLVPVRVGVQLLL
uniref:Putative secreted protein n=1 Tax=Ixodes ricinus TaxID=34613 RepID=A0A147BPT4_IXORI